MLKKLFWAGEFVVVYALMLLAALLPWPLAVATGRGLGRMGFRISAKRRRIALENIMAARESGSLKLEVSTDDLARRSFENLGISFMEIAKVHFGLGEDILQDISFRGIENFDRVKASKRGIIFLTAHTGNWELLALKCSRVLGRSGVVARPLENPYLNRLLERSRAKFGNDVIYKRGALRPLIKRLKDGGIIGILMDQAVLREEGLIVEFFGRGAWTTRMPVLLARRTGAALIPIFIKKKNTGHEITIMPEVPYNGTEEEVLLRLNGIIEDFVNESPAEWLWIHRRWKRIPREEPAHKEPRALAG
jgi:KDO2-lipid IV(A) lauroyltransferase